MHCATESPSERMMLVRPGQARRPVFLETALLDQWRSWVCLYKIIVNAPFIHDVAFCLRCAWRAFLSEGRLDTGAKYQYYTSCTEPASYPPRPNNAPYYHTFALGPNASSQ